MPEPEYLTYVAKNKHIVKFRNLAGFVSGELIVVGLSDFTNAYGHKYWNCKCSCGAETVVHSSKLKAPEISREKTKSCGNKAIHATRPPEDRFWDMVNKTETCWLWTGGVNNKGYGEFNTGKGVEYAHRFSWIIRFGAIPEGMGILHKCDTPKCVNPEHFFLGTHADNMADMAKKGRSGTRKINEEAVRIIRESGLSCRELAARFSLSSAYVWALKNRKATAWHHL